MPFTSKIEYLRTTAKFYIRSRKEIIMLQLLLKMTDGENATSMCKEYTAPRKREDSRPYASIDADQEIGPVLNIGIATVIDVPCIWILISRGHERLVNEIHRHNSDIS